MSSELTIDIQLTELGFSSWDFQRLKQKETSPTQGAASVLEAATSPLLSPCHVDEESSSSVSQNADDVSLNSLSSNQDAHIPQSEEHLEADNTAEQIKRQETENSEDDKGIEEEENREVHEEQTDVREENGSWEIDVDVCDDDEDDFIEDEDDYASDTNDSDEHRCHVCKLTFSTSFLLQDHMHVHTGVRPYSCAECGKQFCQLANYRSHLRSHETFSCLICSETFSTQEQLKGHLDTNHFEEEFYQCDFCKRIFVNYDECQEHLQAHKQEMSGYPCPKCERTFQQHSSLLTHLKWHEKNALFCTDCGRTFSNKLSLLRHSFVHLGLLPYTCVHCKRHFRLVSLYQKHECKPEHIRCQACLVVFQSQDDFDKHKKDTGCWGTPATSSPKTNEIRCMECGQTFDSSEELKKHVGTHQRVLKCSECGMGFRSSLMLMSHMGGHAAVRPCLCKECGLGFPHQHAYDSHLKTCGLVSPPEGTIKKKPKNKVAIASKSKLLQAATVPPQKKVTQVIALQSVDSAGNQTKPSEGPWTIVLNNKERLSSNPPLVMFVPAPVKSASGGVQNPQGQASSSAARVIDVPLASSNQAAKLDKPVLLQRLGSPSANVLVPLTSAVSAPKMRWTILDQGTSALEPDSHALKKENEKGTAPAESKQTNFSQVPTAVSGTEKPLCLVKFKREQSEEYKGQEESSTEETCSSLRIVEVRGAAPLTAKKDVDEVGGPFEMTLDLSKSKKEPQEDHESPEVSDWVSPFESDVLEEDLCQCEICGIVLLQENMAEHSKEHCKAPASASISLSSPSASPRSSPPPGPPCKRPNLG